ncbi:MAG: peptidoglycan DD-metalloendopeptidase family protein [Pirellulales bacterium]|nr:peptidoglycan DD-metalloendopeptidase family protein [Pirellulales bacterium]
MTTIRIKALLLTLALLTAGSPIANAGESSLPRKADPTALQDSEGKEEPGIDRKLLAGKRFKFYWRSRDGGALNGIATLDAQGTIRGIDSPNESTWLLDDAGRLLFKHADGRVSTRYDEVRMQDGRLCFEGPFLFRDGIVHLLIETGDPAGRQKHEIRPQQADTIRYSKQRFVYLDLDEVHVFRLQDGTTRTIRLVSVKEVKDSVIGLVRRAEVVVEIEGEPLTLVCAPYVMPTEVAGLRIQADTTSAWLEIPKRVQFSLWDASDPIVDTDVFCFPLPDYLLFSHGTQAYNEPVHLGHRDGDPVGQCFYHNYGVDLAGYEGRQKVVSCIDGVVVQAAAQTGTLAIQDDRGFILVYGHLDSILSELRQGTQVERGQWVGMLGKRGGSGNFAHLHVGSYLSESAMLADGMNRNLNLYPWLVAAHARVSGTKLRAVARPHHTVRTGEVVEFDGTNSIAGESSITSHRWEFHDGTHVDGPKAKKVYEKPGCYMATLRVHDEQGSTDVDFCKVKVFSDPDLEDVIPILCVTYKPAGIVRVGQPVSFRIWPQGGGAEAIEVDFGDEDSYREYRPYSAITHAFSRPGIHVVTVSATAGGLPTTQKVKVVVQRAGAP